MVKQAYFRFRIEKEELAHWNFYAISIGYDNLSAFVRDSINGLIKANQKPKKIIIIEEKKKCNTVIQ